MDTSTKQAVDEIIAEEKLTVDEIITRCPDGWRIVSEDHFNGLVKSNSQNADKLRRLEKRMDNQRGILLDAIRRIGMCGGQTHRAKDAILLVVVATLANMLSGLENTRTGQMDDLPF